MSENLGEYRGRPIIGTALEVRKIGGGFNDPLAVDPELVEIGGQRVICIPVVCVDHRHPAEDRADPTVGGVTQVHVFDPSGPAFFIDPTIVAEERLRHQQRVVLLEREAERAKARAKKGLPEPKADGQGVLDVDRAGMTQAHLDGAHAGGVVDGCPECEWEFELEAAEADDG